MDTLLIFRLVDLGIKSGLSLVSLFHRASERAARENRPISGEDIDALESEINPPLQRD
jgi:hypothetical protein